MPSTTRTPETAPPESPQRQKVLLGLALAIFALAGVVLWLNSRGPSADIETEALRPLLKNDGKEFYDAQVGLRFSPPPNWGMQGRSTDAPGDNPGEEDRLLVKFKRLIPGRHAAWLRVYVEEAKGPLLEAVKNRDPGKGFSSPSAPQSMTVSGAPAVKVTYSAMYNQAPSLRDVIGVEHGGKVFWFISTYQVADSAAREQTLQAIQSVVFQN
jgi:hypothetical protein